MKTILVIEDNEFIRQGLCILLDLTDCLTIATENGYTGLSLAKKIRPDLILCDMTLPDLNGFDFLKKLRINETTAKIPVVFLLTKNDSNSSNLAWQSGVSSYLAQSGENPQLFMAIDCKPENKSFLKEVRNSTFFEENIPLKIY